MRAAFRWFVQFIIRISVLFIIAGSAYLFLKANGFLYPLQLFEAQLVFVVLSFFFPAVRLDGTILSNLVVDGQYSSFAVSIDPLCIGFFGLAGISILIVALPRISLQAKKRCLLIGIPLVFFANLMRIIASLLVAALLGMGSFDFVHAILFKADLAAIVLLVFFGLLHFVVGPPAIKNAVNQGI